MKKNILLIVSGLSPQVITETVYGLAVMPLEKDRWIPDEVHVISTEDGLTQIRARLFDSFDEQLQAKKTGFFQLMKQDYPHLAHIRFGESTLLSIVDASGAPLVDMRTPEDNEQAANTVCGKICELTNDENVELHVSIAGGRKTLGFYAGYALSLYGRNRDRMSHVMVEERFERSTEFFYPTPVTRHVEERLTGKSWDASEAIVWLADIPFVRLRDYLDKNALLHKKTFGEVIALLNAANEKPSVKVDMKQQKIWLHHREIPLKGADFAFYLMFLQNILNNGEDYASPPKRNLEIPVDHQKNEDSQRLAEDYLDQLERLNGIVDARTDNTLKDGLFQGYFSSSKTPVNNAIESVLPEKIAKFYIICVKSQKKVKGRNAGVYGLLVEAEHISMIE